jgi:murein DD-endopeptidase MepM/ murein hydrolase activator NlpD
MFGIGGSLPDDLDASLPLTKKHNALVREMHEQLEHLKMASDMQMNSFQELIVSLESQKSLLAATPSIRPSVGWISSVFGFRTSPFTGQREFHKGLDIAARTGTPIIAPASGMVTFVGKKGSYGLVAVINHGHGVVTRYGHLKNCMVKSGDRVKRGDKIALIGNSGRTTGPHLHYEVNVNGIPVNPQQYILD